MNDPERAQSTSSNMSMSFYDHFQRGQNHPAFDPLQYETRLGRRARSRRDHNLVSDCFSFHVKYVNPLVQELKFNAQVPERWIAEDELCARFINYYYEPPPLYPLFDELRTEESRIPLVTYLQEAVSSPLVPAPTEAKNRGTNRIRYIIGAPGSGKSALVSRLISMIEQPLAFDLAPLDTDCRLIPVHMDLEDKFNYNRRDPKPLNSDFNKVLFERIKIVVDSRLEADGVSLPAEWERIAPEALPTLCIQRLVTALRKLNYRLVLFVDNLDFYEYYWGRYEYFAAYDGKKARFVADNLHWLKTELTSVSSLGNLGLCVIVALRRGTFDHVFRGSDELDNMRFSSLAVEIAPVDHHVVIGSRIALLREAVTVVGKHRAGDNSDLEALLKRLEERFGSPPASGHAGRDPKTTESPLALVSRLGHHGHRSIIHFLSGLNIGYDEADLFERFFAHEPITLLELYLNHIHRKYTQEQKHFPNLYLNDCMVRPDGDFELAHRPHPQTYWLKFLLLAFTRACQTTSLREVEHEFCTKGKFRPHLLRLCLGSLSTANEFCCLKLSSDSALPLVHRPIQCTPRGEALLDDFLGVPFFLSFRYISAVTDDPLIAHPSDAFPEVFDPIMDSSCLYETGENYERRSIEKIRHKAKASLVFLRVIADALAVEIELGIVPSTPKVRAIVDQIDFKTAEANLLATVEAVTRALAGEAESSRLVRELGDLRLRLRQWHNFFRQYHASQILVET